MTPTAAAPAWTPAELAEWEATMRASTQYGVRAPVPTTRAQKQRDPSWSADSQKALSPPTAAERAEFVAALAGSAAARRTFMASARRRVDARVAEIVEEGRR